MSQKIVRIVRKFPCFAVFSLTLLFQGGIDKPFNKMMPLFFEYGKKVQCKTQFF